MLIFVLTDSCTSQTIHKLLYVDVPSVVTGSAMPHGVLLHQFCPSDVMFHLQNKKEDN